MFRIKICGITNVEDALVAADAGADAIGLNFYEKSPRCVTAEQAADIVAIAHTLRLIPVGVFVNHPADTIHALMAKARFTVAQLHGDETPAQMREVCWPPRPEIGGLAFVIRARRMGDEGVASIRRDLEECVKAEILPAAVLIDTMSPGRYGGTGETVSWVGLADHPKWLKWPLILAGGLTTENVAEAIRIVKPHGVDVASGVESAPGKKDPAKVRDFVAAAKAAFADIDS